MTSIQYIKALDLILVICGDLGWSSTRLGQELITLFNTRNLHQLTDEQIKTLMNHLRRVNSENLRI